MINKNIKNGCKGHIEHTDTHIVYRNIGACSEYLEKLR